jgi:ATP-dependent protease Clp ATPase subunit
MTDLMFRIPSDLTIRKVIITAQTVEGEPAKILRDEENPRHQLGVS